MKMATDNTVDFVVTQNGTIVEDFMDETEGHVSRVGRPAPPMTRATSDSLSDEDDAATPLRAVSDAAALLPPVRTARDVVAALAARRTARRHK
jgi:hypothetical protein